MRCSPCTIGALALLAIAWLPLPSNAGDESLATRRARIEQMSDAEKTRLLEKKREFDDLLPAERQRYRDLHLKLVNEPQYEKLLGTLQRYYNWRKTLTPLQRAELSKLPPDKRMTRVRELMDAQAKENFRLALSESKALHEMLSAEDRNVICQWTDEFLLRHADEILAIAPENPFLRELSKLDMNRTDPQKRVHVLRFIYFRAGQGPFPRPPRAGPERTDQQDSETRSGGNEPDSNTSVLARLPKPTLAEEDKLASRVSPPAQIALTKATEEGERSRIIQNWMRAASFSRLLPPISPRELDRFVDSLDDSERERLESLPRDRMFAELRRLYYRKGGRWGGRGGRWGSGFGPGGRDGGPGGRDGGPGGRDGGPGGRDGGPGGGGVKGGRGPGSRSGAPDPQNRHNGHDFGTPPEKRRPAH